MADKKKILVIDDEADLCILIKENLEGTGQYVVVTSTNPLEAESLCKREKPDLVLLDNIMPTRKGSEIVKVLKNDSGLKSIPIVMISGKGEMVYSKKKGQFLWQPNSPAAKGRGGVVEGKNPEILSKAYGVDDYISKPFTTEILVQVIGDVIAKSVKAQEEG